ncbi:MAG: hypothetical protein KDB52_03770 [Solirubrobacterales bacterium]|nr:hypothetical protein [Solirubrobacterales bacterium]
MIGLATFTARADAARSFTTGLVDAEAFEHGSDEAFDRAAGAGTKIIKNNLYWRWIIDDGDSAQKPGTELEPFDATDPGSSYYHWGTFDRIVRKADARGMEVAFSVVGAPRWARIDACKNLGECSPRPADFANFATAAAERYSGTFDPGNGEGTLPRVRYWQAWVEPNFGQFYKPMFKGNAPLAPYEYRKILNPFYEAIHGVDDSNTVIAAGLAPNGKKGLSIAPLDFTRRALCMTGTFRNPRPIAGCNFKVKADVWAIHPYTTGEPAHLPTRGDDMSVAALPRLQKLLTAATRAGKVSGKNGKPELWVTEFSWDSSPPDPGGLPPALQTRWVAEAMYLMYKANVSTMLWFGLRDQPKGPGKWAWTFQSGLYLRAGSIANDKPKKVLQAYRYPFYAKLAGKQGVSFWGRTPNSKPATIDLFARRGARGGFTKIGTTTANENGIFTGLVRKRGFTAKGAAYAKIRGGKASVAFGLWKTPKRYQPPFG